MDLIEAAASGSRKKALEALRDVLAESVIQADPEKRAPLAVRLSEVLEQLDRLTPAVKAGDSVDEIAKRRAARGAGSATSKRRASADQG